MVDKNKGTNLKQAQSFVLLRHPQSDVIFFDETEVNRIDLALEHLLTVDVHINKVMRKGHGHAMPLVVSNLNRKRLNM